MKILIVGAGTAGVTLARRLLEARQDCTIELIDAGPRVAQGDRRKWLDYVSQRPKGRPYDDVGDDGSDQENIGDSTLRLKGSRYFGEGGSTNAWGGWALRYRPEDFCLHTNTKEGIDWPFQYEELEPYYERAEHTLWVAGTDKPNPALPFTLKDEVIIDALKSLGITDYGHLPLARRSSCLTIGTCKYCPIRQRYIPQVDLHASETQYKDRISIRLGAVAKSLHMQSRSRCAGVWIACDQGDDELVEADLVILALGAVETPKLLLASTTAGWSNGVANDSGHVGRHITSHPLVRVVGFKKGNPDNLEQPVNFPTLVCREFDAPEHQCRGKFIFVRDGRENYTRVENELSKGRTLASVRDTMRDKMPFELRGFIEVFSEYDHYVGLGSATGRLGLPKTKVRFETTQKTLAAIDWGIAKLIEVLEAAGCEEAKEAMFPTIRADHATSTCRMSVKDTEGVVDTELRVHGTDNIYVCSNAAIPNGSAVNPTLTLIALAERLADHLVYSSK